MAHKKFTLEDHFARMDEIRERHRQKSTVGGATDLLGRVRQAVRRPQLPKLPKV